MKSGLPRKTWKTRKKSQKLLTRRTRRTAGAVRGFFERSARHVTQNVYDPWMGEHPALWLPWGLDAGCLAVLQATWYETRVALTPPDRRSGRFRVLSAARQETRTTYAQILCGSQRKRTRPLPNFAFFVRETILAYVCVGYAQKLGVELKIHCAPGRRMPTVRNDAGACRTDDTEYPLREACFCFQRLLEISLWLRLRCLTKGQIVRHKTFVTPNLHSGRFALIIHGAWESDGRML